MRTRWADRRFKDKATAFLRKFVGPHGKKIKNPAILCRKGTKLDGKQPSREEVRSLELSLAFAFVDGNPRSLPENRDEGWGRVTTDNAELYGWRIDLKQDCITINAGYMVLVTTGGYKICDNNLIGPPLDLYMPPRNLAPDPLVLTGIYETVLGSLRSPGENLTADRVRVAVEWFTKAWRNTATVQFPERLVFLKTAFEALTGTSSTWKSAQKLRLFFEELPDTTARGFQDLGVVANGEIHNSSILARQVWSNSEQLRHGFGELVHGVR